MKTKIINSLLSVLLLSALMFCGCKNNIDIDYVPPINIKFGTDNIVQIAKGVSSYAITGVVTSSTGVLEYAVFNADNRSGNITTEIPGTRIIFPSEEKVKEHNFSIEINDIESNKAVKIYARDESGEYFKGFVIKITPVVIFTDRKLIETGDYYYGSFFATWHLGRTYPLRVAKEYPNAVDISFGEITDELTGIKAPVIISPSKRKDYDLDTYDGAKTSKFALTDMTIEDYNKITEVDDAPLRDLLPAEDYQVVASNKVYAYETAEGKKGLVAIHSLTKGQYVATINISAKVQE